MRLYVSGTVYSNIIFKAQYDFAGSGIAGEEVSVKDMYIGYKGIPVAGTFVVGHQKEPFGLEELTSSKYVTFMELSPTAVFDSERNSGMAFQNAFANKRVTATVGAFKTTDRGGEGTGDGRYAITARATGLPWYDKEKNGLFHVGAAYTHRRVKDDRDWGVSPSSHLADDVIETGDMRIENINGFDAEGAFVYGPFSAQGEYLVLATDAPLLDDPTFGGFYAYGSFFITGESRAYKTYRAVFDRVKTKRDFICVKKGAGGWVVCNSYS
jgi:phosphate-selective porin OprO/OprP